MSICGDVLETLWTLSHETGIGSAFAIFTCIWDACKSMVMMWSAPDTDNMLATNLAEMGARLCDGKRSLQSHGISEVASRVNWLKITLN